MESLMSITMPKLSKTSRRRIAQTARTVSTPFARVTAPLRMLPNFLIVGAQRAGTTSLYNYLAQHPDVGRVRLGKGVHYFDTNAGQSMSWYRSHFPLDGHKLPIPGRPHSVGEGAPYYMFHPAVGQRIDAALPGVKLIAILRDPVERAHSQWAHETARGFETLGFEEALHAEADRLAGEEDRLLADPTAYSHSHQHHSYIARGQYASQVERLWDRFGKERVLVLPATHLFERPAEAFATTLKFLDLAPFQTTYEVHNARSYSPIAPETKTLLQAKFADSNARLVEILGPEFEFRDG
jgi:Sulfotransferase domain